MSELKIISIKAGMQVNTKFYKVPSFLIKLGENTSKNSVSENEAKEYIKKYPNINHFVFYGEEPLKYKKELENFLESIWKNSYKITIHTDGGYPVLNVLSMNFSIALYIVNIRKDIDDKYINSLRDLCVYSKDYLLGFKDHPETIIQNSGDLIEKIKENTEEDFIKNYLKNNPPEEHLMFLPETIEETGKMKKICFSTGHYFRNIL